MLGQIVFGSMLSYSLAGSLVIVFRHMKNYYLFQKVLVYLLQFCYLLMICWWYLSDQEWHQSLANYKSRLLSQNQATEDICALSNYSKLCAL